MNTLEITKEAAVKAHSEASAKGKTLLENLFGKNVFLKNVQDRIKSIDDAVQELGEDDPEVQELFKLQEAGITSHVLYTQMLVVITKALNEGWTPDWSSCMDKWFIWFNMSSSSAGRFSFFNSANQYSYSDCGSRLCFKSRELAEYAAKQFLQVYKKSFII